MEVNLQWEATLGFALEAKDASRTNSTPYYHRLFELIWIKATEAGGDRFDIRAQMCPKAFVVIGNFRKKERYISAIVATETIEASHWMLSGEPNALWSMLQPDEECQIKEIPLSKLPDRVDLLMGDLEDEFAGNDRFRSLLNPWDVCK